MGSKCGNTAGERVARIGPVHSRLAESNSIHAIYIYAYACYDSSAFCISSAWITRGWVIYIHTRIPAARRTRRNVFIVRLPVFTWFNVAVQPCCAIKIVFEQLSLAQEYSVETSQIYIHAFSKIFPRCYFCKSWTLNAIKNRVFLNNGERSL